MRCALWGAQRTALERLCRNTSYLALSHKKVQPNATGRMLLKLKTSGQSGTTLLMMTRAELLQRHIDGQLCGRESCERDVS